MSITYVKNKNNPLGTLGSLAIFGGTLTDNPLLKNLGTGMTAANKIMNGNGDSETVGAFEEAIKGLKGWINPAQGNIAKSASYIKEIADSVYGKTYGGLKR